MCRSALWNGLLAGLDLHALCCPVFCCVGANDSVLTNAPQHVRVLPVIFMFVCELAVSV